MNSSTDLRCSAFIFLRCGSAKETSSSSPNTSCAHWANGWGGASHASATKLVSSCSPTPGPRAAERNRARPDCGRRPRHLRRPSRHRWTSFSRGWSSLRSTDRSRLLSNGPAAPRGREAGSRGRPAACEGQQDASRGCARAQPRRLLSAFGALRSRCLSRPIPVTASGVGRLRDRLRTTRTPFVPSCGAQHRTRLIVLGCLMVWSALCPCIACRKRRQRCFRKEETSTWASVESYSLQPSH